MIKNKYLFYLLSFIWGFPMTSVGCFVAMILIFMGCKPTKYGYCCCFQIGENWGGLNLGPVFVTSRNASIHTKNHEHGHAHQNCIFGWTFPFVIGIPSAIRYWYRELLVGSKKKTYSQLPDYDAVWYEGRATKIGNEFMKWHNTIQND